MDRWAVTGQEIIEKSTFRQIRLPGCMPALLNSDGSRTTPPVLPSGLS